MSSDPASSASAATAASGAPSTARRDFLLSIERRVQSLWDSRGAWESDAGDANRDPNDKYLATFPYPYMNGVLHLGHAFTLSKADFQCNYQRLKGKRVLFPFAYHCTGMPIAACADKLKREIITYGNPPQFPAPAADEKEEAVTESEAEEKENKKPENEAKDKKRAVKAKVAKKSSREVYQWNILREMGVPESEIPAFQDARHWLRYFPPLGQIHLKQFGLSADFRRAFITTDINPYYDAFIRWQFNLLKKKDKVAFGARLCVFSPIDNQACADHDRAVGEGVGITDYTLIKLELQAPYPSALQQMLGDRKQKVILPAATLRPETMYGQTNCWMLPEGEYGLFDMNDNEIFICSTRSAQNMAYQNLTRTRGKTDQIGSIKGQELLGCAVQAPLATYGRVYILPLLTIKMDKGTGVVTSVPSDAPDDYAALMDLKNKAAFREKFGIKDEQVMPFEVVEIIETPGLGKKPAADLCVAEKVTSQNDRAKLEQIKEKVYKEGFAKGIMLVGPHAGEKVSDAKPKIKAEMISAGLGAAYSEPESRVVSRSGNECVVALADQWYLKYGEEKWQALIRQHVESGGLECYNPLAKQEFLDKINWMHEWALSRSYGLGTKLPWDPKYVIESLSDSTIYMAYYTIAHMLQQGTLEGSKPGPLNIKPEQLTDEVFDYIFLGHQSPAYPASSGIPEAELQRMRREFEFWYPMNLRVSGKDLIGNHLTMSLYNHAAIWEDRPEFWPRSFYTNGHVQIDSQKMSKSLGNFITITEAVHEFSADATRFSLAEAGDGLEDSNFEKKVANATILKLTKEEAWMREDILPNLAQYRTGPFDFADRRFANEINKCIIAADKAYERLVYRDAVKAAFHDMLAARDSYRLSAKVLHRDLMERYLRVFCLLLEPICPHFTQHLWEMIGASKQCELIARARWPEAQPIDMMLDRQIQYLEGVTKELKNKFAEAATRLAKLKGKAKDGAAPAVLDRLTLFVASEYPEWQAKVLAIARDRHEKGSIDRKEIMVAIRNEFPEKKAMETASKFCGDVLNDLAARGPMALELKLPFDEVTLLNEQLAECIRDLQTIKHVQVVLANSIKETDDQLAQANAKRAAPGRPAVFFDSATPAQ